MNITVLCDNYTYIDEYYFAEPAFSLLIEDANQTFLFDTGYSDIFLKNMEKLELNPEKIDTILLSHGHNDHTGGLVPLVERSLLHQKSLVAHPQAFNQKQDEELSIGSPLNVSQLSDYFQIQLSAVPLQLTERLWFLGEIPSLFDFEERKKVGCVHQDGSWQNDYVYDDTALVYKGSDGLFIISGCSHSGICNICEYAKEVTKCDIIQGVLGGFHLFDVDDQLTATIDYFQKEGISFLAPCHCVSFAAKAAIHQQIPIEEVGVCYQLTIQ